jgi:hypothetical protein
MHEITEDLSISQMEEFSISCCVQYLHLTMANVHKGQTHPLVRKDVNTRTTAATVQIQKKRKEKTLVMSLKMLDAKSN